VTDLSDSHDALAGLVEEVLVQADEIAALDAPRAEAWGSDIAAMAAELGDPRGDALMAALAATDSGAAAIALAALAGVLEDAPEPTWTSDPPAWAAVVGTSRCEGAWTLRSGPSTSIAFRFVDAVDGRHVITIDIIGESPETVGEVLLGPGELLDALEEDDAQVEIQSADAADLARRCDAALAATARPPMSAVVNGRLLLRRLATVIEPTSSAPVLVEEELPTVPERDPEDDAYALDVLRRALGDSPRVDPDLSSAVAALVAPRDLGPLTAAQRDAVLILEWADWLGAVIGLVRAGAGATVDGAALVDHVNRCPEVTTSIPKADRDRIEWAFETVVQTWGELGLVEDGTLTELGAEVLPAALAAAWR